MKILVEKLKDVILSVVPITLIVLIIHFTFAPIPIVLLVRFSIGAILIIVGLALFLFGVELAITPIGDNIGHAIVKTGKTAFVIIFGILIGFMINVAEPDLLILARQVARVTSDAIGQWTLVIVVSIGIGIMMTVGLLRIVFDIAINKVFTLFYGLLFLLVLLSGETFLGIAFDSGGATTGSLTVPFILALGLGVSSMRSSDKSEADSFGLVGISSIGPMLAVLVMSLFSGIDTLSGELSLTPVSELGIVQSYLHELQVIGVEVLFAMLPLLVLFLFFNFFYTKMVKKKFNKVMKGLLYAYVGFVLFLLGVNAGFMEAGNALGHAVASNGNNLVVIVTGAVLGFTVIYAEPAVYVLNEQISDVTSGRIKKKVILYTLAIGVAIAVALSMVRIVVPELKLWHILIPGYIIAVTLSHFAPKMFVGIGFDSGGVASGPMTATFILAFSQGVAHATSGADVLVDGFGVIGTVALIPLIAIQILGLIYKKAEG